MTCRHDNLKTVREPDGAVHHARQVCGTCGRFIKFLPKPETLERHKVESKTIDALLDMKEKLPAWEREFVASVSAQHPKISPKQQEILKRIAETFGVKV